jgi:hypothetical protein
MDLANARRLIEQIPPDAVVADVGGGASPFPRADYVIDAVPFAARGGGSAGNIHERLSFEPRYDAGRWVQVDLCDHTPWPFPDRYFDFVSCSHLLEDVRDPIWVCRELRRVARAGYIEVPSRVIEQSLGVENPNHAGYYHHRWLISKGGDGGLEFRHKPHLLHGDRASIVARLPVWRAINPAYAIVAYEWHDGFEAREILEFDEDRVVDDLRAFARDARKLADLTVPASGSRRKQIHRWLYYRRLRQGRR